MFKTSSRTKGSFPRMKYNTLLHFKTTGGGGGTGDTAQPLREVTALSENRSQLQHVAPITPAPGTLIPSLGLIRYPQTYTGICIHPHTCMYTREHTHINSTADKNHLRTPVALCPDKNHLRTPVALCPDKAPDTRMPFTQVTESHSS